MKFITAIDNSNPIVCIQLYVKAGSVNESSETAGFSHFIEHLTFKSTINFPDNQISAIVPLSGGFINAYTELDVTCYYIMLPSEELNKALQIIADIAYKATFSEEDIKTEKDIIIEEIKQYDNEPESKFIDWIQSTYFINSSLKNPVLGTKDSVKSATSTSLYKYYHKYYSPKNAVIVITGCFDIENIKDKSTKLFSDWKSNSQITHSTQNNYIPEQNGFRIFTKSFQKNGDYLAFVLPELSESNKLNYALLIIVKAFASGKQSRLFKRLVEKDNTALEIKLHSISGLLPGITIIHILPKSNDMIADIVYAFYDEWLRVKQFFFQRAELELIKKELIHGWLYDFEYIESLASGLANEEIVNRYQDYYKFPSLISDVSTTQLKESLALYWKTEYLAIYYQGRKYLPDTLINNIKHLFSHASNTDTLTNIYYNSSSYPEIDISTIRTTSIQQKNMLEFQEATLDNGLRLLMRKVLNRPTIGVALTSTLSQLSESPTQKGYNFFTTNLMLYGTEELSYDDIQKLCLNNGFNIKISHTLETTTFKGKCFTYNLEKLLTVISSLLTKPSLPNKHLAQIKASVIDSLHREKENPFSYAYDKWISLLLGKDTNLNRPYPFITDIRRITIENIRQWFINCVSLTDFTLCIIGDVDFDRTIDLCNKLFGQCCKSSGLNQHNILYNPSLHKQKMHKVDSDQSNLILGGYGSPSTDRLANSAFNVISQILGGELSSRFFNILREKHGYTYQTGFDFTAIRSLGYWFAYAICDKADYKQVYSLMLDIIIDVRDNGVTESELLSAKNYLKGMQRFDMESLSWQATTLSMLYALGYDYDYFISREKRINAITPDIIHQIMQKYFDPANFFAYIER